MTQISKIRNEKEEISTKTKEIQVRTYMPINWKILKNWTNFQILMTIQTEPRGY
jgi:hypothetical protein